MNNVAAFWFTSFVFFSDQFLAATLHWRNLPLPTDKITVAEIGDLLQ